MNNKITIGIAGLGTVAQGLLKVVQSHSHIKVAQVSSRTARPEVDLGSAPFNRDLLSLIDNPEITVVVELIGGSDCARELIISALNKGKHVVTANKALIAECGTELQQLADKNGVMLRYEASVAAGIPIIQTLNNYHLLTGVKHISGIINGSCNYILSQMELAKKSFASALLEAQKLGFAEANPDMDIQGIDSAQKIAILAALCFDTPVEQITVERSGISHIDSFDIRCINQLDYRVKHLAQARRTESGVEAKVALAMVPKTHILASVNGAMNGIQIKNSYDEDFFYCAPGAGSIATATAVYSDICQINASATSAAPAVIIPQSQQKNSSSVAKTVQYYLRMLVPNNPGIISKISSVLGELEVNIDTMIQRQLNGKKDYTNVVLVVSSPQLSIEKIVAQINALAVDKELISIPILATTA